MTSAMENRLAKLEERAGAGRRRYGRIIRVAGGAHTDDELTAFLRSQGIERETTDLVLDREIWQPGDTGPAPANPTEFPLQLLSVFECYRPFEEVLLELGE